MDEKFKSDQRRNTDEQLGAPQDLFLWVILYLLNKYFHITM